MSGQVPFGTGFQTSFSIQFRCLTGRVIPREQVGIFQRGTHRLVDANNRVLATLASDTVNLYALEGQGAIVCGIDEGQIEGVTSLRVTQAVPIQFAMQQFPLFNIQSLQQFGGLFGTFMP
ncbi:MAG: hypothetical protein K0R39_3867 [Symbiobacteriaceae bacterium]|jgi:hypothetical protein|nr:hypothetical protein [Symbiobacteriaceae bacterium]